MSGIVIGIDGSANARRALEWAVREAAVRQAPLTVLTVHEVPGSFWSGRPVVLAADETQLEAAKVAAAELTDKAVSELQDGKPASVTVTAVAGSAAHELLAASKSADILVVGARGGAQAGGLAAHSPIGSVSNKVLHGSRCPVVVVPAGKD